ncbi:Orn/Lys/Arg decarboxylase N-terminal domain-containing protein [Escherichia coli]
MNIIAIMGPHGVFYKDEPIKELESALVAQGFQIIWPQNSVDLLKFIEHNPRICGVIFDWDEYSLDLCSDINQLNEYLPLYAFINTHSTMDVSVQDMRMALWFFEYALGQAEDIAIRMRQYTNEYLDNITPPFTKALFTYVKERKYTFCTPGHMGGTAYQKSPVGCLFYDFFGGNTLKADVSISVTELGSLLDHTGPHLEAEEYIARTFGAEQSYIVTNGTSTSNKIVGMYAAPSGSTLLIDRNCHKSLAHLLMMNEQSYASCQPWPEQVVLDGERETLGLYLTGHPINQYLKEIERYVGGVRLKDMHPTERGKVITAAGLVVAARVMVTKRGNRIGICTLDDRSGRLEVMLFTDALDKYQQLLEKDRILIVSGQVSFDDFSGGLKMTAREVMDIDEAREKYARGLAISLTDRQIDDQLLNRLRQSLEPHRSGTIPVHLYYQRADARARLRFGATWRVSPSDRLLNDLRGLIGSEQVELEFD